MRVKTEVIQKRRTKETRHRFMTSMSGKGYMLRYNSNESKMVYERVSWTPWA